MGKDDVYYSYDVDTGDIVSKTRFNDDGTIDRWNEIDKPGYGHDKYSSSETFKDQAGGDIYGRSVGADSSKEWNDRDGVL